MHFWSWRVILPVLLAMVIGGCGSNRSQTDVLAFDDYKGLASQGVRGGVDFSQQERGERFTTAAPRNQVFLFAYDNSQVAEKYFPAINAQAAYLVAHPGARVMLAGHTDSQGSREYNVALGERRAVAVAELLRIAGVRSPQMRVVSYGEERPIAYGNTEAEYRMNRRVELTYESVK